MILTDDEVRSIVQSDGCDIMYHEESEECSTCRGIIRATERAVLDALLVRLDRAGIASPAESEDEQRAPAGERLARRAAG